MRFKQGSLVVCFLSLVCILGSFNSVKAACDALADFPLSSSNTGSVEINSDVISIKGNNKVVLGKKAIKNAYFNQTVEAAVFPDRLVKVRKFKVDGKKDIKIDITVKTLTSQYRNTDDTLATRTFAISKLDAEGKVDCIGFFDTFSAGAGTTTIVGGSSEVVPGEVFTGTIDNPLQVFITEKGANVVIELKNLILEAGETYQFEFISQGEKSALEKSVTDEEYQVLFGNSAAVDIDDGSQVPGTVTDAPQGVFFAEDSELALANVFPVSGTEVGITSVNGAIAREFQKIEVDEGKYKFKIKQDRIGKKYLVQVIDGTGKLSVETFKKPFLVFSNGGPKFRQTVKGVVTVNADGTQVKDDISYTISKTGSDYLDTIDADSRVIITADILTSKKQKDKVASGYTNFTVYNFALNHFLGDSIVIEVDDTDEEQLPHNLFVDGVIIDPDDTPNGSYTFSVDTSDFGAVILRKGKVITDITVTENPVDISVISGAIFVQNGAVPSDEKGHLTVEVNENGLALLDQLKKGDEIYLDFDIVSGAPLLFEDDYGVVVIRKK